MIVCVTPAWFWRVTLRAATSMAFTVAVSRACRVAVALPGVPDAFISTKPLPAEPGVWA